MNLFDWLNEISYKKSPWSSFSKDDKDNFNSYMINRFVSMKPDYIDLVNLIQKYTIPKSSTSVVFNIWRGPTQCSSHLTVD